MYDKVRIKTSLPGPKSKPILEKMKKLNGGWSIPYPFSPSRKGKGCYFEDIDGNVFLDFACHYGSNPLGYNHPNLLRVVRQYANVSPIKIAGPDFYTKEHMTILEELVKIAPKGLNKAFIVNSGAEAVENAMKICMRHKPTGRFGVSFKYAFHGRTLGALSMTNTKVAHKLAFQQLPAHRLPFDETAPQFLHDIIKREGGEQNISFLIMEPIQGEGGYNIASPKMVKEIRKITKENNIPLISDEVQAGMGRTGKWWSIEHYGVKPDVITAAKALKVGATISSSKMFPKLEGSISSTWGGGHLIDMMVGVETIRIMKRQNLLAKNTKNGEYIMDRLRELQVKHPEITNIRGKGLMIAFDFPNKRFRDHIQLTFVKKGLVTIGCGSSGVRLIPPYIITKKEIDEAFEIIESSLQEAHKKHRHALDDFYRYGEHSA